MSEPRRIEETPSVADAIRKLGGEGPVGSQTAPPAPPQAPVRSGPPVAFERVAPPGGLASSGQTQFVRIPPPVEANAGRIAEESDVVLPRPDTAAYATGPVDPGPRPASFGREADRPVPVPLGPAPTVAAGLAALGVTRASNVDAPQVPASQPIPVQPENAPPFDQVEEARQQLAMRQLGRPSGRPGPPVAPAPRPEDLLPQSALPERGPEPLPAPGPPPATPPAAAPRPAAPAVSFEPIAPPIGQQPLPTAPIPPLPTAPVPPAAAAPAPAPQTPFAPPVPGPSAPPAVQQTGASWEVPTPPEVSAGPEASASEDPREIMRSAAQDALLRLLRPPAGGVAIPAPPVQLPNAQRAPNITDLSRQVERAVTESARSEAQERPEDFSHELETRAHEVASGLIADAQSAIDSANAEREAVISSSRTEADRALAEARTEAGRLLAHAKAEAESIVAEAEADANARLSEAQADSERQLAEGRTEAARLVAEARAGSQSILSRAESTAQATVAQAQTELNRRIHRIAALTDAIVGVAEAAHERLAANAITGPQLAQFITAVSTVTERALVYIERAEEAAAQPGSNALAGESDDHRSQLASE